MAVLMCCGSVDLPNGMSYGVSRLGGGLVATCANCSFVCAYWDCVCELVHDCVKDES
jgi:hypothetical protein